MALHDVAARLISGSGQMKVGDNSISFQSQSILQDRSRATTVCPIAVLYTCGKRTS